jgi:hypothetical protein
MRFEKRIRALEAKMTADPVVLCFGDGSTREICGRGDFLLDLFQGACGGQISLSQAAQLEFIRRAVSVREPGGGHMVELMQSLLNGPPEEPSSVTPVRC